MLRGDLTEFPLLNVLQMLTNSAVSGKVHISHPRGGDLWLQGGEVVHAAALTREGDDALDLLASVTGGEFTFDPAQPSPGRSVGMRRMALLRHLSVSSDDWQELLRFFPNWDRALTFTPKWSDQQPVTRSPVPGAQSGGQAAADRSGGPERTRAARHPGTATPLRAVGAGRFGHAVLSSRPKNLSPVPDADPAPGDTQMLGSDRTLGISRDTRLCISLAARPRQFRDPLP